MKIYTASFDYEVDAETGSMSQSFPTLSMARTETIRLLQERMNEDIEYAEKLDTGDTGISDLTATIAIQQVVKITAVSLCEIINTKGERYCTSEEDILRITLPVRAKRPTIERITKGSHGT